MLIAYDLELNPIEQPVYDRIEDIAIRGKEKGFFPLLFRVLGEKQKQAGTKSAFKNLSI